jgi:uncharacterized repeat protein (TIGR02543 family)
MWYKMKNSIRRFFIFLLVVMLAGVTLPSIAFAAAPRLFYAVTFYQNDNGPDPVATNQSANTPTPLTLFGSLSPAFTDSGYVFKDWSTTENNSVGSTDYFDGETYSFASTMSLYAQWTPDVYTLSYSPDGGTVSPTSVDYTVGDSPLTLLTPSFTGYAFQGWNTASGGGGTMYSAGASFTPAANVTLYAQWTPAVYTLSYAPNGGTVSPTSVNYSVVTGPLNLLTPTFSGYVFEGWNSASDGGGTMYAAGASYTPVSNVTLYAQWTPNSYTLSYAPNGGTVSPTSVNFTVGASPLTLSTPTNSGYIFLGWNTALGGGGVSYAAGASYSPISNITLYAQWTIAPAAGSITIVFVPNGAIGAVTWTTTTMGAAITLPNGSSLTNAGHTFAGWNTNALGTGTNYLGSTSFVVTSPIFLYAQWTATSADVVTFAPNGGVGTVTPISGQDGTSVTLPGGTGLSYAGHTFASWNTAADGSGTVLNVNSPFLLANSMTLYAQWDALLTVKSPNVLIGAVGSFALNSSQLTKNLKIQVLRLALLTKTSHFASETMYGYANDTGSPTSQMAVSTRRANAVANYLRAMLASLHVRGVKITAAGEGAFKTGATSTFRRVEIFVKG